VTAVQVQGLNGVAALAAGSGFTCALRADSAVSCWGSNSSGRLGIGSFEPRSLIPVAVPSLNNIVAIAAGSAHGCALSASGNVACWGSNSSGQLGNGTTQSRNTPDVVPGLNDAVSISAGENHTCAVRADGRGLCWGRNLDGELAAAERWTI
jgi:alpha-tubulin suppressor-like RCC1 family protein